MKKIVCMMLTFIMLVNNLNYVYANSIPQQFQKIDKILKSDNLVSSSAIDVLANDLTLFSNENDFQNIKLGDYILLGNYYGEKILWRCVSFEKIAGYDDDGNPIMDATDTVTEYQDGYLPLMLSDKIICMKSFDAGGNIASGSHGRGRSSGYSRKTSGSNYWGDSNIRDWLNSDDLAGKVIWTCGNPPDKSHIKNGFDPYDQEAGFLTHFNSNEISTIKAVVQKQLLDGYEYSKSLATNVYQPDFGLSDNYDNAYSEILLDKIFLLDTRQAYNLYNSLGNYYYAYPTSATVDNSSFNQYSNFSVSESWDYWLRSSCTTRGWREEKGYGSNEVYCARRLSSSDYWGSQSVSSNSGIRPAFFLNLESVIHLSGSGSESDPYVLNGDANDPIEQNEPHINTKIDNLDAEIIALNEIEYNTDKKTYDKTNFLFSVRAKKKILLENYDDTTEYEGKVNIEVTLPEGFSFSESSNERVRRSLVDVNFYDFARVYVQSPKTGDNTINVKIYVDSEDVMNTQYTIKVVKTGFQEDIYRADHNVNRGVAVKNIEKDVMQDDTPSKIFRDSARENGVDVLSYTWKTAKETWNSFDDPSKIADYAFEEKDMYKALIFDMLDCKFENEVNNAIGNKNIKEVRSFESEIMGILKDKYTYEQLTDNQFFGKNKDDVLKLVKNRWIEDHTQLDNVDTISGFVFKGVDYLGSIYEVLEQISLNYQVYMLEDGAKQFITDMYEATSDDNIALKTALYETKEVIESSEEEFWAKMAAYATCYAGKKAAQSAIGVIWKNAKDTAIKENPTLLIAYQMVKGSFFVSEKLFNTSKIGEAYFKLNAVLELWKVVEAAYKKEKSNFINNKSINNAKNYNSAINILGAYYILDCKAARSFPEAVEDTWTSKVFKVNNAEELKRSLDNIKRNSITTINSANTEWIEYLAEDYPELYNYYDAKRESYKVYDIACPVDVYVFDKDGVLVASSIGDKLYCDEDANLTIYRIDDKKTVYTYADEYTVIYKGTDNGKMDIEINEYVDGENTNTVNFNAVPLTVDCVYTQEETGKFDESYSIKQDNIVILPNYEQITTAPTYKLSIDNGLVEDTCMSEGAFASGQKVKIFACIPEGYKFNGWKSNKGTIVFDDTNSINTTVTMTDSDLAISVGLIEDDATDSFKISASDLKLGDYVKMGNYLGDDIVWRCVSFDKITGYDKEGNPIIDPTDTVTEYQEGYLPLMLSDKILCLKAFDANGDVTSGSHGRGYIDTSTSESYRQKYGSNYWKDSNIRDWLNSNASAGNVEWSCGNPPDSSHVQSNPYVSEAGFLNDFSNSEKSAIREVAQKQYLDGYEYSTELHSNTLSYTTNINYLSSYCSDKTYNEISSDNVFLLDVVQLSNVFNNFGDYYMAYPSKAAVENSKIKLKTDSRWSYWLRSPHAYEYNLNYVTMGSMATLYVSHTSGVYKDCAFLGYNGIRPAFYMDPRTPFKNGNGTLESPYSLQETNSETLSFHIGDADGDNVITASDAAFVLQKTLISTFELPIQDKTEDWLKYTDVDADNNITASDATFILQKALISTFELPAEKKNK